MGWGADGRMDVNVVWMLLIMNASLIKGGEGKVDAQIGLSARVVAVPVMARPDIE